SFHRDALPGVRIRSRLGDGRSRTRYPAGRTDRKSAFPHTSQHTTRTLPRQAHAVTGLSTSLVRKRSTQNDSAAFTAPRTRLPSPILNGQKMNARARPTARFVGAGDPWK